MASAPALLVLLLLCVCEVEGAQESPPSLSDVMREVKVLTGMVADLRGDNKDMASRLSASEAKMGEFQTRLNENVELVKGDLTNLTDSYNQLQTRFDQLQSSYQQLISPCNPVSRDPVTEEDRKKRLCESDGFTWDGGVRVCYYLSKWETKTWDESREFCRARQADLIIINSQEKQDLVERVVPSSTQVWIGLSGKEYSYKWVDGTPLTSPTFWGPLEPSGVGDPVCVYYYYNGRSARGWNDGSLSYSARWLCERVVQ